MSYADVVDVAEATLASRASSIGQPIALALEHYVDLLRRYVVPDSAIPELCAKIWRHHGEALEMLYEHRPDLQRDLADYLTSLIEDTQQVLSVESSKQYVRFAVPEWDDYPCQLSGPGNWAGQSRLLLFEFVNQPNMLGLKLELGPGPAEYREAITEFVAGNRERFPLQISAKRGVNWTQLAKLKLLARKDLEGQDLESLTPRIEKRWTHFLSDELPIIRDEIASLLSTL